MSAIDPTPPDTGSPRALEGYTLVLATIGACLVALVAALATRNPRMVMMQVVPTTIVMMLGGGAAALWLLRRTKAPLWLLLTGPAAATTATMLAAVMMRSAWADRNVDLILARPLVERGLVSAPLLGALIGAGLWLLERARQRERAAWQAEAEARARETQSQHERGLAQLQLLQAQIEPHFIYNTLANLRQLVKLDSARALQMLDHLIRYFKLVLPSFREDRLPLRDELALVQAYLDLLRERMGRPMRMQVDVPEHIAGISLLPGALLCFAENAVKHGLPEDGSELKLLVSARQLGSSLVLRVQDNGAGPPAEPSATDLSRPGGTGIANLRERLRLLYGDGASVHLYNIHPGCEAVLTLPWETPATRRL
jgi:signal transduction histidine kinase